MSHQAVHYNYLALLKRRNETRGQVLGGGPEEQQQQLQRPAVRERPGQTAHSSPIDWHLLSLTHTHGAYYFFLFCYSQSCR